MAADWPGGMPAGAVTKLRFPPVVYKLLLLYSPEFYSPPPHPPSPPPPSPPPTPPGEDLADALYNTVADFLVLVWVLLDYLKWSQKPSQSLIDGLARSRTEIFPCPRKLHP